MRVFLITGASSGIGRAVVERCARAFADAHFVLTARREAELQRTAQLAGLTPERFELVPLDITEPGAAGMLVERTHERFGQLDVLVNNAGVDTGLAFEDAQSDAAARSMIELNLLVPMELSRAALPLLERSGGSIVNVASVAGLMGQPNTPEYSASKWGLVGFSDSLRARVAGRGVHVATVNPGPVPTAGWPHEYLTSRRMARPLYCSADAIGAAVVLAVRRRRAILVRPRLYSFMPVLRALAPGAYRAALRAMPEIRSGTRTR